MSGTLFAVEVENTTDVKIGRAGKIFLPKATRVAKVSIYGLAEIRACKGLAIRQSEGAPENEAHVENPEDSDNSAGDETNLNDSDNFSCEQCDYVGKSIRALKSHIKVKHRG